MDPASSSSPAPAPAGGEPVKAAPKRRAKAPKDGAPAPKRARKKPAPSQDGAAPETKPKRSRKKKAKSDRTSRRRDDDGDDGKDNDPTGGADEDDDEGFLEELGVAGEREQDRTYMLALVDLFSRDPEQLRRYESYRRSGFSRAAVKKLMQSIGGHSIPPTAVIVMAGAAKLFAGDLVEEALEVAKEWKEDKEGDEQRPLRPRHLREAFRRLRLEGRTHLPTRRITFV